MIVHVSKPLFPWDHLESSPSLKTIRNFLETIPDANLIKALEANRGRGRNDYPISILWGVCLLRVIIRHSTMDAMLQELHRNPALCLLIGVDDESQIPDKYNMSRFEKVLGLPQHLELIREIFNSMVRHLSDEVCGLGENLAGDASALHARPQRGKKQPPSNQLPTPSGGKKEYLNNDGEVTETYEWFGYKFHLVVDTTHEIVLGYSVTSANEADNKAMPKVLELARENIGDAELDRQDSDKPRRIRSLAYDKACDDIAIHQLLDSHNIAGIIQTRNCWKGEPERMLPDDDGNSNVVYDEQGTLYCYDKTCDPPVRHKMAFMGYEKSRGTLKYRCPAVHSGCKCPSIKRCSAGRAYGKTKRVKCETDLRRFCRTPRATQKFERLYKKRTAVERVNARLKVFWGLDDGNVTGSDRFHARLSVVMLVHIGFANLLATQERWEGTLSHTSLSSIAKKLRKQKNS